MKWKSLEAVEIISPKKKKGLIAKAHKYKNCLVIDVYRDGGYYGRYAMDLDTGEYEFRKGKVTHKWKMATVIEGKSDYWQYKPKVSNQLSWDTEKDRITATKSLGGGNFGFEICSKEEDWLRNKRERSLELKYDRIRKLMGRIPPEPADAMKEKILDDQEIIFFFLDKTKKLCKCPICKEEFPRKDLVNVYGEGKAKHNDRVECPNCSREGLLKTRRNHMEQYGQILLLQNIDEEVSVARRFKWAVYSKYEYRTCTLDETIRIMMYRPHGYKIYYSQDGEYQNWYTGLYIPEWNDSNPCNKRVTECSLYPDGISEALKGTDYESLTRAFEAMANEGIVIDYNAAMAVGAKEKGLGNTLEYLLKGRFTQLLKDTIKNCWTYEGRYIGRLDLDGETIEEVFRIKDRQKINRIRQVNGGENVMEWMQYSDIKNDRISQDTLQWIADHNITVTEKEKALLPLPVTKEVSVEKFRNYLEKQSRHYAGNVKDTLEHWGDYLSMMVATDQKLDDELFYKPKNLKARHDALVNNRQKLEAVKRMNEDPEEREEEAKAMRDKFPEAEVILQDVREKYSYQGEEYIMRIPKDLVEIVEEGYALHHCGGSSDRYFNRICNRETYIGFCRKVGEENIPFYTIEFEPDGTIRQNRSYYDEEPDIDTIRGFLKEWQREVKKRLNRKDLEYAKKSAVLREQNIQELKERNNNFVLQKLAEDFMAAG